MSRPYYYYYCIMYINTEMEEAAELDSNEFSGMEPLFQNAIFSVRIGEEIMMPRGK